MNDEPEEIDLERQKAKRLVLLNLRLDGFMRSLGGLERPGGRARTCHEAEQLAESLADLLEPDDAA